MTIILEPYTIPEKGKVELQISRSFEIKVTADEARRQVNRWLLNEVSYLIGAEPPTLVVGEHQVVWRVPAAISFPHTGRAGVVGTVEVDITTGAMNNSPECKAEIERRAKALAARQPPYRSKGNVPEEYLAKDVPAAPELVITAEGQLQAAASAERIDGDDP
jgi:hypothetical protein